MAYATRAQLAQFGISAGALSSILPADQDAELQAASDRADDDLRRRYTMPVVAPFPPSLIEAVCKIAVYNLLSVRGYAPDEGSNSNIRTRFEDAIAWLNEVGNGDKSPAIIDSSSAVTSTTQVSPEVVTNARRGWGSGGSST